MSKENFVQYVIVEACYIGGAFQAHAPPPSFGPDVGVSQ